MQLWVNGFQIRQLDGLAQQLLVERDREAPVDVVSVEHSQAHYPTNKVEVRQMILQETPTHKAQFEGTAAQWRHLVARFTLLVQEAFN